MKTFLFALTGEDLGRMPADEAAAVISAETSGNYSDLTEGLGWISASFEEKYFDQICSRLALTKEAGELLCTFSPDDLSQLDSVTLPEGSFAVRATRYIGMMQDIKATELTAQVGKKIGSNNTVNLKNPDITVRLLMSDVCKLFLVQHETETGPLRSRKVSERPFFSPISLHPKYARALINLTGVKRREKVLDPFCGTGGIAIEAAAMGMKAYVSDFDSAMVDGTLENLDYFGYKAERYEVCDIRDIPSIFSEIDSVVCDPPYGRSTKTGGVNVDQIYSWATDSIAKVVIPGKKVGMVLPHELETKDLIKNQCYKQYVHGSLNRYYHVFTVPNSRIFF